MLARERDRPLPTDTATLQALLAARAERDAAIVERDRRCRKMIACGICLRQLQRAQFGRRSEKLDPEQLHLALEDIEQAIAANEADDDKRDPDQRPRPRRQASDQSRRASRPSAARPCDDRARRHQLPVLPGADACDRRGDLGAARRDPGAVPGDRHAPSQIRLPGLRGGGGAGAGAGTADQGRAADRGDGRLLCWSPNMPGTCRSIGRPRCCATQGIDITRSTLAFWVGYAAAELSRCTCGCASSFWPPPRSRSTRRRCRCSIPAAAAPRQGYFWADRPRRPALGRARSAGRRLHLRARSRRGPRAQAARALSRHRAVRRLCCLQEDCRDARDGEAITLAFCWAHLRAQFFDIAEGGDAPIASEALERIAALYAIEKTIRGKSADDAPRRAPGRSKPLVAGAPASGSSTSSRGSRPSRPSPRTSATASTTGTGSPASSTTVASSSTPTSSSVSVPLCSTARMLSSPATMTAPRTGPASPRSIETCKLNGVDPQAYLATCSPSSSISARLASRRAHAVGLGRTATSPSPRGLTHRLLAFAAVRSMSSRDWK